MTERGKSLTKEMLMLSRIKKPGQVEELEFFSWEANGEECHILDITNNDSLSQNTMQIKSSSLRFLFFLAIL